MASYATFGSRFTGVRPLSRAGLTSSPRAFILSGGLPASLHTEPGLILTGFGLLCYFTSSL